MSKRNKMPGLRLKGGIWHIEKRSQYAPRGWLRESTGTSGRAEAEQRLIRRLAEIQEEAKKQAAAIYTFEEAGLRYLEDIAHSSSAETMAIHLDQVFVYIGERPLEQVHDGTLKPFVDERLRLGKAPKSINNAIGTVSAVLNRAARVWRNQEGVPWLRQAPPRLSRLSLKGRQKKPYPLSWEEQDRLFSKLPRHLADAATFAVNTGCREQEVCQLRWEWEVKLEGLSTSAFVLPESITKTSTDRVVVLNTIARSVIDSRRELHDKFVFAYRGNPVRKLRTSAWIRAWTKAGLPTDNTILKGVHNLRHTFGRRLRSAGIPLETRKALLGHASGDITTHYSAAELSELLDASERVTDRGGAQTPTLTVLKRQKEESVGKLSEIGAKVSGC